MYSADVPSVPSKDINSVGANLDMPLNFGVSEDPIMSSWYESWRDQNIVDVCELHVSLKGYSLSMCLVLLEMLFILTSSNSPRNNTFATYL